MNKQGRLLLLHSLTIETDLKVGCSGYVCDNLAIPDNKDQK